MTTGRARRRKSLIFKHLRRTIVLYSSSRLPLTSIGATIFRTILACARRGRRQHGAELRHNAFAVAFQIIFTLGESINGSPTIFHAERFQLDRVDHRKYMVCVDPFWCVYYGHRLVFFDVK